MFNYFYHGLIRKYVVAFGTLFNNIYISRVQEDGSSKKIKIPLAYAPKERYILDETLGHYIYDDAVEGRVYHYAPRMSFQIEGMNFDTMRKRNSLSKTKVYEPTADTLTYSYAEVPYNIEFVLNITTRKMDDGLQIVEQILPYFAPEFTLSLDLTEFARKVDIPITLTSYNQTIEYEGELPGDDVRITTWELRFNMRAYLYGPARNGSIIKQAIAQFFDYDNEYRLEALRITATGGTGSVGTGTGATLDPDTYGYLLEIFGATASDSDIFD